MQLPAAPSPRELIPHADSCSSEAVFEALPWRLTLQQAEDGEVDGIFAVIQSPAQYQALNRGLSPLRNNGQPATIALRNGLLPTN